MRSRLPKQILNGHPHSILGKTLLLALVFCLVLSGTRSFSAKADTFRYQFGVLSPESTPDNPVYMYNNFYQDDSFTDSLEHAINNVNGFFVDLYPNFSFMHGQNGDSLYESIPAHVWNYLQLVDLIDPEIYVNVYYMSFYEDFSRSYLVFTFSKTKEQIPNWTYTSSGFGNLSLQSNFFIWDNSGSHQLLYFNPSLSIASSYTGSASGSSLSEYPLNSGASYFGTTGYFYDGVNNYFDDFISNDSFNDFSLFLDTYNSDFTQNIYRIGEETNPIGNHNLYLYPIVCMYDIYTLGSNYQVNFYHRQYSSVYYPYITYISNTDLEQYPVFRLTNKVYNLPTSEEPVWVLTPTPIPSVEAYPTPTAFPTIAINNNLTPIPEEWDPGIIWEDITTDDVAGNLHGVITTITDFISSAVPRFYSEVLTIFYRRSDWFSFLAIIPGLSLIIFIIGRLRRK